MTETLEENKKKLFAYAFGLSALAVVFIIEARYILHFLGNDVIDTKQFDLLMIFFTVATIIGGIATMYTKQFDIAIVLLLIGILECMFGVIEYIEGSIMTITFVDYVFTTLMFMFSAIFYLGKKYGIAILTTLTTLMFFCFNLNNMFGASFDTQNWAVGIFGLLAGTWCIILVFLKYSEDMGLIKQGLL